MKKIRSFFAFLFVLFITQYCDAQKVSGNLSKFENDLFVKIKNEIVYKGYDFEGFTICVKINDKGKIDTTLISVSALPELNSRLNRIKASFNFQSLNEEIKIQKWANVNILIPVFSLYESTSPHKSFIELGQYASDRLNYFFGSWPRGR